MTQETETTPPPEPAPLPAGSRTGDSPHEPRSRPWELELLISGAVVFALLQLPGQVDAWYEGVFPHVAGTADTLAWGVYYYTKLILYTLIASLLLHLAVRAFWVGLIGLESVYPSGVRWDHSLLGPVTREVYRRHTPPIQEMIDRADRFCSVIFSAAFAVVFLFVFSVVITSAMGVLAWALSAAFLDGEGYQRVFTALGALIAGPSLAIYVVEKAVGPRLDPSGRAARVLRALSVFYYYLLLMPVYGVIYLTLATNLNKRVTAAVFPAMMFALFFFVTVKDVVVRRETLSAHSYLFLPEEAGPRGVSPDFYDNLRPAGDRFPQVVPSIQSDVVAGPYLKLFVPYLPRLHNPAFRERCPGLRPLDDPGVEVSRPRSSLPRPDADVDAVLRCWTQVQRVTLNGRALAPAWRFHTHPRTGLRGIVAYLPTDSLPRGENVLMVTQIPRPSEREKPVPPHYIPFWR